MPPALTCTAKGCAQPPVAFKHFPTIAGYCATHGGVIADWLSLVNSPSIVGFDATRARWEARRNFLGVD